MVKPQLHYIAEDLGFIAPEWKKLTEGPPGQAAVYRVDGLCETAAGPWIDQSSEKMIYCAGEYNTAILAFNIKMNNRMLWGRREE